MDEMLLSVIIPAYRSEATIAAAIQSVCREFDNRINYEVLVVENGPADGTARIVEKLAEQGVFVNLFHSKQGVSNAGNVGIAKALGTWLMFVDADDTLHPGCGARLAEIMQNSKADLCLFGHRSGRINRPVCDQTEICRADGIEQARVRMLQAPTRYMQVWAKLFRRQRVLAAGVLFEPELYLAEDSDFTFQYTAFCREIAFYPEIVYDYHMNLESVMHTFDEKKADGYVRAMTVTADRAAQMSERIQEACRQYILAHFHIAMVNGVFAAGNPDPFKDKIHRLKQTAIQPVFAEAVRRVSLGSGGWILRGMNLLLKGHMYGMLGLVYTFRVRQKKRS